MRDYQRSKLYDAENVAWPNEADLSLDECETFAKKVLRSRRIQQWFPLAKKHADRVSVQAPKRGTTSWTDQRTSVIYMAAWTRCRFFILHEVSHLLTPPRLPFHGKEFAGVFLKLVKYWLGMRAWKRLKKSFDAGDVDYKEVA